MTSPETLVAQLSSQITALDRQLKILKAERAVHILDLRRNGASLGVIAKVSGLTRQRVLQIVQNYEATHAAKSGH